MAKEIRQKTEQQALQQLTLLCAQSEHCERDIMEKMAKWELPDDVQARIMEYLIAERFIDNERYCRGFIHDKMEYNHWGPRKIEQALWMKGIPHDVSSPFFAEIADQRWLDILQPLLQQKRKSTKGCNEWEINQKLLRFAASRGFTFDQAKSCLNCDDIDANY